MKAAKVANKAQPRGFLPIPQPGGASGMARTVAEGLQLRAASGSRRRRSRGRARDWHEAQRCIADDTSEAGRTRAARGESIERLRKAREGASDSAVAGGAKARGTGTSCRGVPTMQQAKEVGLRLHGAGLAQGSGGILGGSHWHSRRAGW